MEIATARKSALAFLQNNPAGVIATVSREGTPHASAIYYVADDRFNIYFLTKFNSRKYAAMKTHPNVALTVGRLDVPQTLQIEGVASELESEEDRNAHVPDLMNRLAATNIQNIPLAKMDSDVVVMWIEPKWIRWGDFAQRAVGNDEVFIEIPTIS